MYFIYEIRNKINNKVYFGKTKNLEKRINKHRYHVRKRTNRYLYDAINHYGWDNFQINVILKCREKDADKEERYFISKFKSNVKDYGYNMTEGGDGGAMSPESIQKMIKNKKGFRHTQKSRDMISEANKGKRCGNENPAKRPEVRKKISETRKDLIKKGKLIVNLPIPKQGKDHPMFGKTHTEEVKKRLSLVRKGKTYEEFLGKEKANNLKRKRGESWKGEKNPNFGKKPVTYINLKLKVVKKHISQSENIEQLANLIGINVNTLKGKFRREFNTTFLKLKREIL